MDSRLKEILKQSDVPEKLQADLTAAAERVAEFERGLFRADVLMRRYRTELLCNARARELSALVWSSRQTASACGAWLHDRLGGLEDDGALASVGGRALHELQCRLEDARQYLYANDRHWEEAPESVSAINVFVHSQVVPGTALGSRLAGGYAIGDSFNRYCAARYCHVPDLAQTTLTDADGRTLFSGLRHSILHAAELDGSLLRRLADEELGSLVGVLLPRENAEEPADEAHTRRVDEQCRRIRGSYSHAAMTALTMRSEASMKMARETAAAALIADNAKFRRALGGETVNLDLFCVSLLAPGEFDAGAKQAAAVAALVRSSPVELRVCDSTGAPRTVRANVKARRFALSSEQDGHGFPGTERLEATRLLGRAGRREPAGDLRIKVNAMVAQARDRCAHADALLRDYARITSERGVDHPDVQALNSRISGLLSETGRLQNSARTVEDAGVQLNALRAETGDWAGGIDASMKVASRLALAGCLMGETPVLICMSGRDFTRQLDAEVKFLATVAHAREGRLPPIDLDMGVWGPVRDEFRQR